MKKILIVGYGAVNTNYGTVCMSYAMQKALEKNGVQGELIKLINPNLRKNAFCNWLLKHKDLRPFRFIIWFLSEYYYAGINFNRRFKFICFEERNIHYSPVCFNIEEVKNLPKNRKYDAIMTESDCIWHPCFLNEMFTLDFNGLDIYRFTYAPSMFVRELSNHQKRLMREYKSSFDRINKISVREKSAATRLEDVLEVEATPVIDPVLLLEKPEWHQLMAAKSLVKGDYIFAYILEMNLTARRRTYEIAHILGIKKIVWLSVANFDSINHSYPDIESIDMRYRIGPDEFLRLINDAAYVSTDSFHLLNLSLVFEKVFFLFERRNLHWQPDDRVRNILDTYQLHSQMISLDEKLTRESIEKRTIIDYESVRNKLANNRKLSYEFLKNCIEEIDK